MASRIARWQAERTDAVTNQRHEVARLTEFHRRTLQFLDGRHDRSGLLAELAALVRAGTLMIHEYGQRVENADRVRGALQEALDLALPQLGRNAFLSD